MGGAISKYLENANHSVGYQHVVCVCACHVLTVESNAILNKKKNKHLSNSFTKSHSFTRSQKEKSHCGPALLQGAQPNVGHLGLSMAAG